MRLRIIAGLLAVVICMTSAVFSSAETQDNISMPAAAGSKAENDVGSPNPSTNGFKDLLDTPAMMSAFAQKSPLVGIALAGKRVLCVGIRGHILYSDDLGKNWTQAKVPVSIDLTAVYFPSPQKGWAVGHDGVVLHSTDAGATWEKRLDGNDVCRIMENYYKEHPLCGDPDSEASAKLLKDINFFVKQGPVNPFLDVWFENESTGFVVGAFNLILHTSDGGKSWEPWYHRTENPLGFHFYCIRPCGKDLYLSGEQGMVWKLDTEKGVFRSIQTPYFGTFFGIVGKAGVVLAYGQRGNLYRSKDGGASWEQVESGVSSTIFFSSITEDGRIVLVTQGGNVIISKDDGMSFTEVKAEGSGIPNFTVAALGKTLVLTGLTGVRTLQIE